MTAEPSSGQMVWRYMSFSRFVWMLKEKALWLTRADHLSDKWEMRYSRPELEAIADWLVKKQGGDGGSWQKRLAEGVATDRSRTFVNCWTAADSESHAMWNIYCRGTDGIAVQTTLEKLKASVEDLVVQPVRYQRFDMTDLDALVKVEPILRKREPYSYEQEHRIVSTAPPLTLAIINNAPGYPLKWDPEQYVDRVLIHPGADWGTQVAIEAVIKALAPMLVDRMVKSAMAELPPDY